MKNFVVLCLSLLIFGSGYGMQDFMESSEPTTESSASLRDGQYQPKWMQDVEKLCRELRPYIEHMEFSRKSSSSEEGEKLCEELSSVKKKKSRKSSSSEDNENNSDPMEPDSDDELDGNRKILEDSLKIYQKSIDAYKKRKQSLFSSQDHDLANKTIAVGCLSQGLDSNALTANKIVAVAWLSLVNPEHKQFFRYTLLEWAYFNDRKPVMKYLLKNYEIGNKVVIGLLKENKLQHKDKEALNEALNIYKKTNPYAGKETLKAACIPGIANNLESSNLTSNKVILALFLSLIDPEHKECFKQKLLEWSIANKHKPAVEYLVVAEAANLRVGNTARTLPIILACEAGDEEIFKYLADKGGLSERDKNKIDENLYQQALATAKRFQRKKIEEFLEHMKAPNEKTPFWAKFKMW